MPRVVCLEFRQIGRGCYFDAGELDLRPREQVVTRTARGLEIGVVRTAPQEIPAEQIREELPPIVRRATKDDLRRAEHNLRREAEALEVARAKVIEHQLDMKPIEAEMTLDGSRIVIHFSAEGRVDFRALVRDLAKALRARVELHQVGVRDEAKLRGGVGHCGRELCCATFLNEFAPVGIRMAKEQELSLNPQKISGLCGRLMCCLAYEYDFYHDARQCLPKVGSRTETDNGPGKIVEIDVVAGRVVVNLDEGGRVILEAEAFAQHRPGCPHCARLPSPQEES